MIIGQATVGIEMTEDMSKLDAIILPTIFDVCGFTAAIAMSVKEKNSDIKVIVSEQLLFYDCQL